MSPEQFADRLLDLVSGGDLEKILKRNYNRAGLRGMGDARVSLTKSGRQRSGNLRNSIGYEVRESGGNVELALQAGLPVRGANVIYAAIQEYGGIVRKRPGGPNLSVPIHPDLFTGAGVSRYDSPRDVPEPLRFALLGGRKFLVHAETGEPYYALKESVKVEGRGYLADGARGATRELLDGLIAGIVEAIVGV